MATTATPLARVNEASLTSQIPANIATNIPSNVASYASYASLLPSGSLNQVAGIQSSVASAQSDINSVQTTFSSWDGCMSKAYCKWPVIVAIIIASLIVLSLVICIVRCAFCGAECCCACCSCFTPSRRSRKSYSDPAPRPMPYSGYQPQPGPVYAPQAQTGYKSGPQFATFDASTKPKPQRVNGDSLPTMPTWDTATSRKVLDESHVEDVEMGELTPVDEQQAPMLTNGAPNQRVRFAGTPNGSLPGTPVGGAFPLPEQDIGDGYARPLAGAAVATGYSGVMNPARNASGGFPQQGYRQASGQSATGYGQPNAYIGSGGIPAPNDQQSQQYNRNTPYSNGSVTQSPYTDARSPQGQPQAAGYFAGHDRQNSGQSGYSRMQSPQNVYPGYNAPRQPSNGQSAYQEGQSQGQRPQQTNYPGQNYSQPQQTSYSSQSQPYSQSQPQPQPQQNTYGYGALARQNTSPPSIAASSPPSYHTAPPSVYRRPAPQQAYQNVAPAQNTGGNSSQQYSSQRQEYQTQNQSYAPQQQRQQQQQQQQQQGYRTQAQEPYGYSGGYAQ